MKPDDIKIYPYKIAEHLEPEIVGPPTRDQWLSYQRMLTILKHSKWVFVHREEWEQGGLNDEHGADHRVSATDRDMGIGNRETDRTVGEDQESL